MHPTRKKLYKVALKLKMKADESEGTVKEAYLRLVESTRQLAEREEYGFDLPMEGYENDTITKTH